jgi:hypothetical protein
MGHLLPEEFLLPKSYQIQAITDQLKEFRQSRFYSLIYTEASVKLRFMNAEANKVIAVTQGQFFNLVKDKAQGIVNLNERVEQEMKL